jgi:hypothetical protein
MPGSVEERESVAGTGSGVEETFGVPLAADRFAYVFGPRIKLFAVHPRCKL